MSKQQVPTRTRSCTHTHVHAHERTRTCSSNAHVHTHTLIRPRLCSLLSSESDLKDTSLSSQLLNNPVNIASSKTKTVTGITMAKNGGNTYEFTNLGGEPPKDEQELVCLPIYNDSACFIPFLLSSSSSLLSPLSPFLSLPLLSIMQCITVDQFLELTHSEDPVVRKKALRELCPCHVKHDVERFWQRIIDMRFDPDGKFVSLARFCIFSRNETRRNETQPNEPNSHTATLP